MVAVCAGVIETAVQEGYCCVSWVIIVAVRTLLQVEIQTGQQVGLQVSSYSITTTAEALGRD